MHPHTAVVLILFTALLNATQEHLFQIDKILLSGKYISVVVL